MKVLFITRKYPPQIGGMEKYSYELIRHFPTEKEVIALRKSQLHLIWFLPYALVMGLFLARQVDLVHLGDGLLAPLGWIIKKISGKPAVVTVHGLDVIYDKWLYQSVCASALKNLDKVIAVSESTKQECLQRGVSADKCVVVPNGVVVKETDASYSRSDLTKLLGANIGNKKVLLTVGRLVPRKGVVWFIENVLSQLENVVYVVVGRGSEEKKIRRIVENKKLEDKVFLLTGIVDDQLEILYHTADLFIMPNVKVKGDREGFGLVALEAAARGLVVVAAALEGIQEAIANNQNGILIEAENGEEFAETSQNLLADDRRRQELSRRAREYTLTNFSWDKIAERYFDEISKLVGIKSKK
ncbi:glycosyltransferase family 4 protein [Patescibacteria group bacterium]|nr:glycosyltransferase family 4 protein [Patescibacteria group bacterium]